MDETKVWFAWIFYSIAMLIIPYCVYRYQLGKLALEKKEAITEKELEIAALRTQIPPERPIIVNTYRPTRVKEEQGYNGNGGQHNNRIGNNRINRLEGNESHYEENVSEERVLPASISWTDFNFFVRTALKSSGPGLAIGKWKSEMKWRQEDIEAILDFLADIEVITPRQNGRACEWIGQWDLNTITDRVRNTSLPHSDIRPINNMAYKVRA